MVLYKKEYNHLSIHSKRLNHYTITFYLICAILIYAGHAVFEIVVMRVANAHCTTLIHSLGCSVK